MAQINKIKIRRGPNASLPAGGTEVGELRYSTDTQELYVDDGTNNVKIASQTVASGAVSTAQAAADALRQPLAPVQLYGSGAPASGLGKDTDTYTDYTNAKKYTKASGAWTVTTDTAVSKEVLISGTWSTTAGTLSADTSDGMTSQKIAAATTGAIVTFTFTNPVDLTNKLLRMPFRVEALSDWNTSIGPEISDTVGFTGRVSFNLVDQNNLRGGEPEAFTMVANTGYVNGSPNLAAVKYLRMNWVPSSAVARNAFMGQPVAIG